MKQKRFSKEQIIGILKQNEAGMPVAQLRRERSIGESTFYKWKSKFGGMSVSEAKRLRQLKEENAKLKRLLADAMLADAMLDNAALKDVLSKTGTARCQARSGAASTGTASLPAAAGLPVICSPK